MDRPTVKQLRRDVEELLKLAGFHERYLELQKKIKGHMVKLKHTDCQIEGLGRVFVTQSERVTVSPALAREVLGTEMAKRVIVVKESVPNDVLKAFVKAEEISEADRDKLLKKADRVPVVSLYVRPLK